MERARRMREARAIQAEKLRQRREEENRRRTSISLAPVKRRLRDLLHSLTVESRGATSIDDRNQRLLVWLEAALQSETHWQLLKYLEQVERLITREPAPQAGPETKIDVTGLTGRVAQMIEPGTDEDEDEEDREAVAG